MASPIERAKSWLHDLVIEANQRSEQGRRWWHYIGTYLTDGYADQMIESAYGECPYYLGEDGGTCSMSCQEEPECMTCCPSEGWPNEPTLVTLVSSVPFALRHGLADWRGDRG